MIVSGLAREVRRAALPNTTIVMSGGQPATLERALAQIDPRGFRGVISFGLAGALDPSFRAGDLLLPEGVTLVPHLFSQAEVAAQRRPRSTHDRGASFEAPLGGAPQDEEGLPPLRCSPESIAWLQETAFLLDITVASRGPIAGSDTPLLTADAKRDLRAATGAVAVDMESHLAAAWAARHGLPFGILRVISDEARGAIPPAALAAMRPDGGIDAKAALWSILRRPTQIPALVGTARDGAKAFRVLDRLAPLLSSRP